MAKLLKLIDDVETIAFVAVVNRLKNDPTLKRVIPDGGWITFTEDTEPVSTSSALPSIELLPYGVAATPETNRQQNAPFGIHITVSTGGTDVRDSLNLWAAVRRAIFPGDGSETLTAAVNAAIPATTAKAAAQVVSVMLQMAAVAPTKDPRTNSATVATGALVFNMLIPK